MPGRLGRVESAWRLGRSWNHLRYVAALLDVIPPPHDAELTAEAGRLWADACRYATALAEAFAEQEQLLSTISAVQRNWDEIRRQEAFADARNADLGAYADLVEHGRDDGPAVWRIFGSQVRVTTALFDEAWLDIRSAVAVTGQQIMDVARCVDRAVHPLIGPRELTHYVWPNASHERQRDSLGWRIVNDVAAERSRPSYRPVGSDCMAAAPHSMWWAELRQRLVAFGRDFVAVLLNRHNDSEAGWTAEQIVSEVEREFLLIAEDVEWKSGGERLDLQAAGRYLGVEVDASSLSIRRDGFSETVKIDGSATMRVFTKLLEARGRIASVEKIQEAWLDVGNTTNLTSNQISNYVSKLRHLLRALNLEIKNNRRVGWSLQAREEVQEPFCPILGSVTQRHLDSLS